MNNEERIISEKNPVIFYDGVCALCNGYVKWVLKNDREKKFLFSAQQSDFAKKIFSDFSVTDKFLETIVLYNGKELFFKSDAVLRVASVLPFPLNMLRFLRIIPPVIRDFVYTLIARMRYKLFGKYESCPIMPTEVRERFIE